MADEMENSKVPAASTGVVRALLENRARFLSFLTRRTSNRATAEELLQTAFVRALEAERTPERPEEAVRWFYRILRNALADHRRREQVAERALEREAWPADAAAAIPEAPPSTCRCMHQVLPTLKPAYAELVRRVDLEEGAVPEAARALAISPNNAAVRLHRARQALKKRLTETCGACAAAGCLDCSCGGAPLGLG